MNELSYDELKVLTDNANRHLNVDLSVQDINFILEKISFNIRISENEPTARKWALMGLKIVEKLESQTEREQLTGMNFRMNYLLKWGKPGNEPSLDPVSVVNWAFNIIDVSVQELKQLSKVWQTLDVEQIKTLRSIKNRLRLCEELKRNHLTGFSDEQNEYLEVISLLP